MFKLFGKKTLLVSLACATTFNSGFCEMPEGSWSRTCYYRNNAIIEYMCEKNSHHCNSGDTVYCKPCNGNLKETTVPYLSIDDEGLLNNCNGDLVVQNIPSNCCEFVWLSSE